MKPNPRFLFRQSLYSQLPCCYLRPTFRQSTGKKKCSTASRAETTEQYPQAAWFSTSRAISMARPPTGASSSCRGPFQCGTVYQLQPPAKQGDPWTETVLWVFKGSDGNDGASPFSGLVWDQAGNLYGATGYDGSGNCMLFGSRVGCGVVYQLKPPQTKGGAWTETVLYNFQGGNDGQLPIGDLVFDSPRKSLRCDRIRRRLRQSATRRSTSTAEPSSS